MKLNFRQYSEQGDPLVILHGLFGSLKNWNFHARELASQFAVYSLDLRNHGDSPHENSMTYPVMAEDVLEFLDAREIRQAHILGHSMGGKVAMQLALDQPRRVNKLLVVDIAPVRYEKNRGDHEDVFLGLAAVEPETLASRAEADEVLGRFIDEPEVRQFLLSSLVHNKSGGYRWRFNLTALKSNYDNLRDKPDADKPCEGDVLFVKGALSNYIQEQDRKEIMALFPAAKVKIVMGAGHWVHAQKPQVFNKIAREYFMAQGQ
ncbi:MAG: alpha/beta fold hydrolase [Gammaproteobacteria bacterium]|nr:alpha/beta fold hydrolase [Gammaproteobacteria bacterium]